MLHGEVRAILGNKRISIFISMPSTEQGHLKRELKILMHPNVEIIIQLLRLLTRDCKEKSVISLEEKLSEALIIC